MASSRPQYQVIEQAFKGAGLDVPKIVTLGDESWIVPKNYPVKSLAKRRQFTQSMWRAGSCMRRLGLKYAKRLKPKSSSMPLEFGTMVHDIISQRLICDATGAEYDKNKAYEHISNWRESMFARMLENENSGASYWTGKDIDHHVEMALYVFDRWCMDSRFFKAIVINPRIRVPLINPVSGRRSPIWDFSGEFDALVVDKHGRVWVWELKTTKSKSADDFESEKEFDPQTWGYMWGARQIFGRKTGIIYDVLQKRVPKSPKMILCKKGPCVKLRKAMNPEPGDTYIGVEDCDQCGGWGYIGLSYSVKETRRSWVEDRVQSLETYSPKFRETQLHSGELMNYVYDVEQSEKGVHYTFERIETPEYTNAFVRDVWGAAYAYGQYLRQFEKSGDVNVFPASRGECRTILGACSFVDVCPAFGPEAYEAFEVVSGTSPVHHTNSSPSLSDEAGF
jgi:hypothetical protein